MTSYDVGELLSAILNEDLKEVKKLTKHLKSDRERAKTIILSEAKYTNTESIEIPYLLASKSSTFEILEYLTSLVNTEEINRIFSLPGGSTNALLTAIEFDRLSIVDWLLCNGADASCEQVSEISLHKSVKLSNYKLTKLLLQDPSVQLQIQTLDSRGQSPLHVAVKNGHASLVELLLNHGADAAAYNSEGLSSIHLAAIEGHLHIIRLLCDRYKADSKQLALPNKLERSALHFAANEGNHEAVSLFTETYLLEPNLLDANLNNVLHCCFISPYNLNLMKPLDDYRKTASIIFPRIVDVTLKNKDNLKAEDLARLNGYIFCEEIFSNSVNSETLIPKVQTNGSVRKRVKRPNSQRTESESQGPTDNSNRNSKQLIGSGNLYGFGMATVPVVNLNNSNVDKGSVSQELNHITPVAKIRKSVSAEENLAVDKKTNATTDKTTNGLDALVLPLSKKPKKPSKKEEIQTDINEKNNKPKAGNSFKSWLEEQAKMMKEQDKADESFPIAQSTPPPSEKLNEFPFPDKLVKIKNPSSNHNPISETKSASKNKPPPPPKLFKFAKRKGSEGLDEQVLVKNEGVAENRNSNSDDVFKPIPKPRIKTIPLNSNSSDVRISDTIPDIKPMSTFSTKNEDDNLNIYKPDTQLNKPEQIEPVKRRGVKNFPRTLSKTASIEVAIPNPYELNSKLPNTPIDTEVLLNTTPNELIEKANPKFILNNDQYVDPGLILKGDKPINELDVGVDIEPDTKASTRASPKKVVIEHEFDKNQNINAVDKIIEPKPAKRPAKNVDQPVEVTFVKKNPEVSIHQTKTINNNNIEDKRNIDDEDSFSEDSDDSDDIADQNMANNHISLTDVKVIEVKRNAEKKFGFSIVGGNNEGIFLNTLVKTSNPLLEVGDQIVGVDGISTKGKTREEMYKLLEMYKDSVLLSLAKNISQYHQVVRSGTGDKFYVRAKFFNDSSKKKELKIKEGDIFCVTDSLPDKYDGFWQAQKMQGLKGEELSGFIPNRSKADQILMKQQLYASRNGTFLRSFRRAKSVERLTQRKLNESVDSANSSMMINAYERVIQKPAEGKRLVVVLGLFCGVVIELLVRDSPEVYTSLPPNTTIESENEEEPVNLKLLRALMTKTDKSLLVMLLPNSIEFLQLKTNLNPIVIYISPVSKVIVKAVKQKLVPNFDKNPSHLYSEATKFEKNNQHLFTSCIAYTNDDWWFFNLKETISLALQQPVWISEEDALLAESAASVPDKQQKQVTKPKAKARTTDDLHNTSTASLSRIQTTAFDTQKGRNNSTNPVPHERIIDPKLPKPISEAKVKTDEAILRPQRPSSKFDQTKFIDQHSDSDEDSDDYTDDSDDDESLPPAKSPPKINPVPVEPIKSKIKAVKVDENPAKVVNDSKLTAHPVKFASTEMNEKSRNGLPKSTLAPTNSRPPLPKAKFVELGSESESDSGESSDGSSEEDEVVQPIAKSFATRNVPRVQLANQHSRETPI